MARDRWARRLSAPTHLARASKLLAARRLDEAAAEYQVAIDAAPDYPIGYLLLADLYGSVGLLLALWLEAELEG
jgi:hypothetical protein